MEYQIHEINTLKIAELISADTCISTIEKGSELLATIYYEGADKLVVYDYQLSPAFFDLSSGMAGELLQKFSNFRVKLVIVGDFSVFSSNSLKQFILESNKGGFIQFLGSRKEAFAAK